MKSLDLSSHGANLTLFRYHYAHATDPAEISLFQVFTMSLFYWAPGVSLQDTDKLERHEREKSGYHVERHD